MSGWIVLSIAFVMQQKGNTILKLCCPNQKSTKTHM
jgi:hypothetical protein